VTQAESKEREREKREAEEKRQRPSLFTSFFLFPLLNNNL